MMKVNKNSIYQHDYKSEDLEPVPINTVATISASEVRKLVKRYNAAGFVIFELLNDVSNQDTLLSIAKQLSLGEAFVPNIYSSQKGIYEKTGLNNITVNDGLHRAFQTDNEQRIHSDGTLEVIGKVKTSILLCVTPANSGGETVIFNSSAAFYEMLTNNQKLASSLLDEQALRRVAVNGKSEEYIGPAFVIENGDIISRFSLDNTSDWEYGFKNVKLLNEAYSYLLEMINFNSPYYIETMLNENQGIIMKNHKISHGRKHYIDDKYNRRHMIRGLFEESLDLKY